MKASRLTLEACWVMVMQDPIIAAAWSSALTTMLDALDLEKLEHLAVRKHPHVINKQAAGESAVSNLIPSCS